MRFASRVHLSSCRHLSKTEIAIACGTTFFGERTCMLPRRLRHAHLGRLVTRNDGHLETRGPAATRARERLRKKQTRGGVGAMSEDDSQAQRCSLRQHKKAARFFGGRQTDDRSVVGERNNFEDRGYGSAIRTRQRDQEFLRLACFFFHAAGSFDHLDSFAAVTIYHHHQPCRRNKTTQSDVRPSRPSSLDSHARPADLEEARGKKKGQKNMG